MTKTITLAGTVYERHNAGWISTQNRIVPSQRVSDALDRIEGLERSNELLVAELERSRANAPADGPIKSSIPCELVKFGDAVVQPAQVEWMAADATAGEIVVRLVSGSVIYVPLHKGNIEADLLADLTYRVNKSITDAHRRIYDGKN